MNSTPLDTDIVQENNGKNTKKLDAAVGKADVHIRLLAHGPNSWGLCFDFFVRAKRRMESLRK